MGVLGGDNQGFPNGRRLGDDIVDIEEQAVAGFLRARRCPLGDGVNANDVPSWRTSRTCPTSALGLREREERPSAPRTGGPSADPR